MWARCSAHACVAGEFHAFVGTALSAKGAPRIFGGGDCADVRANFFARAAASAAGTGIAFAIGADDADAGSDDRAVGRAFYAYFANVAQ